MDADLITRIAKLYGSVNNLYGKLRPKREFLLWVLLDILIQIRDMEAKVPTEKLMDRSITWTPNAMLFGFGDHRGHIFMGEISVSYGDIGYVFPQDDLQEASPLPPEALPEKWASILPDESTGMSVSVVRDYSARRNAQGNGFEYRIASQKLVLVEWGTLDYEHAMELVISMAESEG